MNNIRKIKHISFTTIIIVIDLSLYLHYNMNHSTIYYKRLRIKFLYALFCLSSFTWSFTPGTPRRIGETCSITTITTNQGSIRIITSNNNNRFHRPTLLRRECRRKDIWRHALSKKPEDSSSSSETKLINTDHSLDIHYDPQTTLTLVAGQSLLIPVALALSLLTKTPNWGFGPNAVFDWASWQTALLATVPLGVIAWLLDFVEDRWVALQDVSKATQRSVLALLGGTFKPVLGLVTSVALGVAAGLGEELLFRGILQYELASRMGSSIAAVGLSSVLFGLLHAVTPLYAIMAGLASVYFGSLYLTSGNLAVPILCHTLYDIGALCVAHWTVARMSPKEQRELSEWPGPGSASSPTRSVL